MTLTLSEFMAETKKEFPDFEIRSKDSSLLMKVIAVFLRIITFGSQKTFMTSYTTTIRHTIYTPAGWDEKFDWPKLVTLRHERVHMRQADRMTFPVFMFLYLFCPLPFFLAYFRAKFEWEAYTETMKTTAELYGIQTLDDGKVLKNSIFSYFTTGAYGWMWPFPSTLEKWWQEAKKNITATYRV